jgi:NACalpha-BTF3-like transcription factor
MDQTRVDRARAIAALITSNGDIVSAIMDLTM